MDSTNGFLADVQGKVIVEDSQGRVGVKDYSDADVPSYQATYEYPPPDEVRIGPYYLPKQNRAAEAAPIFPFVNQATMGGLAPAVLAAPMAPMAPPPPTQGVSADRRGKYAARSLLPDITMARLAGLPFDPHWLINNGVNPSVLSSFGSKMKFEAMFGQSALQIADVLKIVAASGAIVTDNEAIVTALPATPSDYPDFCIRNVVTGATSNLQACKGVRELYQAMTMTTTNIGAMGKISFSTFHVYRHNLDLGDLSTIRQALEVYIEELDVYTTRNGGTGRKRRL